MCTSSLHCACAHIYKCELIPCTVYVHTYTSVSSLHCACAHISVLVPFLVAVVTQLACSGLRREGLFWLGVCGETLMVGKAWWQEHKDTGHIESGQETELPNGQSGAAHWQNAVMG